jgi:hypothetical protein
LKRATSVVNCIKRKIQKMKLSEIKNILQSVQAVNFKLPDGSLVPQHFHVTEVGQVIKKFIDCGGTVREEKVINFQLWQAEDFDHRLKPQKLLDIIALSEKVLNLEDLEIEVEYQSETIGKFGLHFNGENFVLLNKQTDCLAPDKCAVPPAKQKVKLSEINITNNTCTPGGGCC